MPEYGFDKTEFMKFHLPIYIILIIVTALVFVAKSPLLWQLFISGFTILITIVAFLRYGPKDSE
jgi:hypothetical protein